MSIKESNEITVKIKCSLNELYSILENKGFKKTRTFSMDDYYYVPQNLELDKLSIREIISKAVLIRDIIEDGRYIKKITYKTKKFDEDGNILSQDAVSCDILNIEDAKKLLVAIGYKQIMNIKESDIVCEKQGFELAIKDIKDGDNLIEIETEEDNDNLNTIEKLKERLNEVQIPVYTDNYFIKKAEIELDKILNI